MTIHEIAGKFSNAKVHGNEYIANCPICGKPKLHISPAKKYNGTMLHCFVCDTEEHGNKKQADILEAVGLSVKDVFADAGGFAEYKKNTGILDWDSEIEREATGTRSQSSAKAKKSEEEKTEKQIVEQWDEKERYYTYTDETGMPKYSKKITAHNIRYSDGTEEREKTAYNSRINLDGTETAGLNGEKMPVFHLYELTKAKQENKAQLAFVVEGEKDVLTMEKLGYVATTLPNGGTARTWEDSYTAAFTGVQSVIVLTDNDTVGKGYGQFCACNLERIVQAVYVVPCEEILEGLQEKGDITDIFEKVGETKCADFLRDVIHSADKWRFVAFHLPPTANRFTPRAERWLWCPYIPLSQFTLLVANTSTGKGTFYTRIAAELSRGRQLPTDAETPTELQGQPQRTLILSAEETGDYLSGQLFAAGADMDNIRIVDTEGKDKDGNTSPEWRCDYYNFTKKIGNFENAIREFRPQLVIVDPLETFLGDDVNMIALNDVTPVMRDVVGIAMRYTCAMLFICHTNRRTQIENALDIITGSNGFANCSRSVLALYKIGGNKRVMVQLKVNHAEIGRSLYFCIRSYCPMCGKLIEKRYGRCPCCNEQSVGVADLGELCDITAEDVVNAQKERKSIAQYKQDKIAQDEEEERVIDEIRELAPKDGKEIFVPYEQVDTDKATIKRIFLKLRAAGYNVKFEESPRKVDDGNGGKKSARGFKVAHVGDGFGNADEIEE